jgi:histidine ammonia-lyase
VTLTLSKRADINLESVLAVAWKNESVRIGETALEQIARCRASFLELIDSNPAPVIYGVTTAMGEMASTRLEREERDRHARIKAFAAATSFGDPYPDRIVRGMVLARLANFLEGNAATSPRMALAVAEMLDGQPMPHVPSSGQGGAGEILAPGDISNRRSLPHNAPSYRERNRRVPVRTMSRRRRSSPGRKKKGPAAVSMPVSRP